MLVATVPQKSMSFRGVSITGEVRLFGDEALRQRINTAATRLIKDGALRKRVVNNVLNHEVLVFDNWSLAEQRLKHGRARICRQYLNRLSEALANGANHFRWLRGVHGIDQADTEEARWAFR